MSLISIIVPFYNEEVFLEKAVLLLLSENFKKEIILVNDGSVDASREIALNLVKKYKNIRLIDYMENKGKGYAVKQGIKEIKGEVVGIYDADLEYSAKDLSNLVKCIKEEDLDFVCGSRFIENKIRNNIYFRTLVANKLLSLFFSIIYKNKVTDVATCLKVFKKELLEKISLEKNDFSIEVEILAKALLHTSNYKEIAISYNGRSYEDGKKIKFIDSLKYVLAIIRYR